MSNAMDVSHLTMRIQKIEEILLQANNTIRMIGNQRMVLNSELFCAGEKIQELEAEVKVLQLAQEQDKETIRWLSSMNEKLKEKLEEQPRQESEIVAEVLEEAAELAMGATAYTQFQTVEHYKIAKTIETAIRALAAQKREAGK